MHIRTVSVTFLQLNKAFNDFKEGFVNRIREKLKTKNSQIGNKIFGWVGRRPGARQTNIFKVGLGVVRPPVSGI